MNWNPLKILSSKSIAANGGMASSSFVDEEQIESINNRVIGVESATKKIYKSGKKLNEAILTFHRFESKLSNDISESGLCQQYYPDLRALLEDWHTFNCESSKIGEDNAVCVQKMINEPMKKYDAVLGEVKNCLKKRDQLKNECLKLSLKVSKQLEKEKTGQNLVKLEQMRNGLSQAEDEYKQQSSVIVNEVPSLLEYRINYFQPCLEGFIKAQVYFWGESLNHYENHSSLSSTEMTAPNKNYWREQKQIQDNLLSSISHLSIVDGTS